MSTQTIKIMTREEIYTQCVEEIAKTNCLLLEAATGTGKTKVSIDLSNLIMATTAMKENEGIINILLLVAKRVHKTTWIKEIAKWGGLHHPKAKINVKMECYESLKNHCREQWDIIIADEVHHIGSELRLGYLRTMSFRYFIGLSATIPKKLKSLFFYRYYAAVVSCDVIEAIKDDVLPEPEVLLFPLTVDNLQPTETREFYKDAPGPTVYATYKEIRKYKYNKRVHSIITMTQKQKLMEYDNLIDYFRKNGRDQAKLYMSGKRLEYLATIKIPIIKDILRCLNKERTITFCKTIEQAEAVSKWCIHSKNDEYDKVYEDFNAKKIDHISAVNILNENANLVDCKYAIFTNLSSSEISVPQRIGRALRHSKPVIIIPYFQGTREEEIVADMVAGEGWKKKYSVKTFAELSTATYVFKNSRYIHSIKEIC